MQNAKCIFFRTVSAQLNETQFPCSLLDDMCISQFPQDSKAISRERLKLSPKGHKFHAEICEDHAYMKAEKTRNIYYWLYMGNYVSSDISMCWRFLSFCIFHLLFCFEFICYPYTWSMKGGVKLSLSFGSKLYFFSCNLTATVHSCLKMLDNPETKATIETQLHFNMSKRIKRSNAKSTTFKLMTENIFLCRVNCSVTKNI